MERRSNFWEGGKLLTSTINLTNLNSASASYNSRQTSVAVVLSGKGAVVKGNTITAGNSATSSSQCIVVSSTNATIADNMLTTGKAKADVRSDANNIGKISSGSVATRISTADANPEITNNTITSTKGVTETTRNAAFAVDGDKVNGTINAMNNTITLATHTIANNGTGGYGVVLYLNTNNTATVTANLTSNIVTGSTYVIYADNSSGATGVTVNGAIFNNNFKNITIAVANHSTVTLTDSDLKWNTTVAGIGSYEKIVDDQTYVAGNYWQWSPGQKSTTGYLTFANAEAAKAAGLPVADLAPLVAIGEATQTIEVTGNFSIENTSGTTGTLTAAFTGGTTAEFDWTITGAADIITLTSAKGSPVTYKPLRVGTTTVKVNTTVNGDNVEASILITVYETAKPNLPVSDVKTENGKTTITNTTEVTIEKNADNKDVASITDSSTGVVMNVTSDDAGATPGSGNIRGNVSAVLLTYPTKKAGSSSETQIVARYALTINLGNVTNYLPEIDPSYNKTVAEKLTAGLAESSKYTFVSMITAKGDNVTKINENITANGIEVTFTIPLAWANEITNNNLGKIKVFHINSTGAITGPLTGTGKTVGENYLFTAKGSSFSSYVLAAFTYIPPVPPANYGSSSGGNSDGGVRVLFETTGGSYVTPATGLSNGDVLKNPRTRPRAATPSAAGTPTPPAPKHGASRPASQAT